MQRKNRARLETDFGSFIVSDATILHRLRSHDSEITSFQWMRTKGLASDAKKSLSKAPTTSVIETPPSPSSANILSKTSSEMPLILADRGVCEHTPSKLVGSILGSTSTTTPKHRERLTARRPKDKHRETPKAIVDADDMFDMFSYDYEQPEFGVMSKKQQKQQTKNAVLDDTVDIEDKQRNVATGNANFDFVEACQSLRTQIELAKNEETDAGDEASAVNMSDIRGMTGPYLDQSLDALSIQSTIGSSLNQSELAELEQVIQSLKISDDMEKAPAVIYLASGSVESCVCIWDIGTGRIADKIQFKSSHNRPPIPSKLSGR